MAQAKVAIVGRPNVGKSSLFNRIIGERLSITDDAPGITRDRIYGHALWLNKEFAIIDTGGIELQDTPFLQEIKEQVEIAIDEADVIVFLTDCRNGITNDDEAVAKMLYKSEKPVILAVNKVDDKKYIDMLYEFYGLGFGEPIPISSAHGIGIGDLLDKIISLINESKHEEYDDDVVKFSLIGRPNVGKSSLANRIIGKDRSIVSEIEGTTRDSIDTLFTMNKTKYVIIDTAGIRKRGKIYENAEKYSILRAEAAIERSDLVILLIDANIGIIEQDKHVASYVDLYKKACIICVNKWDLIEKDDKTMKLWTDKIRNEFKFLDYAPICFVSAKENKRIHLLFPDIDKSFANYSKRVQTSVLNDCIVDAVAMNPSPEHSNGKARFYYATQVGIKPPTFVIFVNDPECIHFSYERYLENHLRKTFDFSGTPIKIIFRKRD